jgi:HD-GYP domain-containing protein (c-di-GMP phosphodiesterase class II)
MTWIADAISQRRASILDGVSGLLPDLPGGSPFRKEELLEQASFTLDMLGDALRSRDISHLFTKWEAIGSACAQRDVPMDEIPNVPDLVKRSAWALLSKLVGEGDIELDRLVEGMMEVEKVLSDCWFALVRSYLQTEDVALVARNDHIEALYSLTEVLSSEGEESIYQNIVDKVAGITGLPRCSLLLLDDDGRLVPTASNYVDALEKLNRLDERTIDALSVASYAGMPVVLEKDENTRPGIRDFLDGYHSPVVLAVPMKSGDKSSGLLLLDAEHKGEFTWEQVDLAVASASQATMAIEKSELLSQMESRLKHMAAIGIVARSLTSHLNPREQLESIIEMANALLRADGGVFLTLEEMFSELKLEAACGKTGWAAGESFMTMAQLAYENNEVIVWHAESPDERFGPLTGNVVTSMTSPLMVRDKAIGVLCVASTAEGESYGDADRELFSNFAAQAAVSVENTRLYERLQDTYLGAIGSLAAAIEARDPYTVGHSARVTQYAVAIAESMDLPLEEVEELRLAGILHDLGKIGVPDSILNKPGRLSDEEYSAIKMHPVLSMRIIEPLPHLGNIIPIIYHHHERYDGNGYMDGKSGNGIPLGARIIAVADSYEAMTSDRPYRKALSREEAVAEIARCSGTQFDPEVVKHFLALLDQ